MGYDLDDISTEYAFGGGWIDAAVRRDDGTIVGVEWEIAEGNTISNSRIACRTSH